MLEELIHIFWRNSEKLCSVFPSEHFVTGIEQSLPRPCVFLFKENEKVLFHTNKPTPWKKIALRFEIHHDFLDQAMLVAKSIEENFDRLQLKDQEKDISFSLNSTGSENIQAKDGYWKIVLHFEAVGQ